MLSLETFKGESLKLCIVYIILKRSLNVTNVLIGQFASRVGFPQRGYISRSSLMVSSFAKIDF